MIKIRIIFAVIMFIIVGLFVFKNKFFLKNFVILYMVLLLIKMFEIKNMCVIIKSVKIKFVVFCKKFSLV